MNALIKCAPTQKVFEPINRTEYKSKRQENWSLQESSPIAHG